MRTRVLSSLLRATGALLAASVASCGARAPLDSSPGSDVGSTSGPREPPERPPPGFGSGGATSSRPSDPMRFDTAPLGECVPGYPERGERGELLECPFKFEGRCHEDWDSACACACPRVQDTQCVAAGFFGPGPLEVRCYTN